MQSHYQPLAPNEVVPEIAEHLRAMWRQGLPASELVRDLYDRGMHPIPIKISFQAAFRLDDHGDVTPIGGWLPDGSGELSAEQLQRLMAPKIEHKRSEWDTPRERREEAARVTRANPPAR